MVLKSKSLLYRNFGHPLKVVELTTVDVKSDPEPGEVLVEWLASPINPVDMLRIMGAYIIKEKLPMIGGTEGVGRVVKVSQGPGCKFQVGDHVTINSTKTLFWTEYAVLPESDLIKIDKRIPVDLAATLMVNPTTAWIMIHNYTTLTKGDYIIQNSANSGVGRSVIEIAKASGFKSINIVRNRENIEELKTELWKLGGDHVFTEEEFAKTGRQFIRSLENRPKLAFNGVGGRSALQISSVLENGGTCITYGGMSRKDCEFSTSDLIFKDITVKGFSLVLWTTQPENASKWKNCVEKLQELAVDGKLTAIPMDKVKLEDFGKAIKATGAGKTLKQLFVIKDGAVNSKI